MTQTNIQHGQIVIMANEDLAEKQGHLVKIVNNGGLPAAALPDSIDDLALYVVIDGDAAGGWVAVQPLSPDKNIRVVIKGACGPGDALSLANPDGTDDGKVRVIPADPGSYRGLLVAEEAGVDGQLIKARPAPLGLITVTAP